MKLIVLSTFLLVTFVFSIKSKQTKHQKLEKVHKTRTGIMIIPADDNEFSEHWDVHNSRFRRNAFATTSEHIPQADLAGDVIFTARKLFVVDFTLGTRQLGDINVTKAFIQLYHRQQLQEDTLSAGNASVPSHPVSNVRISVGLHQLPGNRDGWPQLWTSSKLLDSRIVDLLSPGWAKFDISRAVFQWLTAASYQEHDSSTTSVTSPARRRCLDVWAESHGVDYRRLQLVQHVRLVTPASRNRSRRPRMVVFYPSSD